MSKSSLIVSGIVNSCTTNFCCADSSKYIDSAVAEFVGDAPIYIVKRESKHVQTHL